MTTAAIANRTIAGRLFLVGCERSGTTLLQAMLANHSRMFSFPESHFFCRVVPRRRIFRALGIANPGPASRVVKNLAKELGQGALVSELPSRSPSLAVYAKAFARLVDTAALHAGRDWWLEKTPHHLQQVRSIARLVPNAQFIHILRDGRDVTASIRDAANRDPDYWGDWSIDRLTQQWNESITTSLSFMGKRSHWILSYEALLDRPHEELLGLCNGIGIDYEDSMLRHWEATAQVTGWMGSRPWMEMASQPLQDTRLKKFHKVFTPEEQVHLKEMLLHGGDVAALLGPVASRGVAATR